MAEVFFSQADFVLEVCGSSSSCSVPVLMFYAGLRSPLVVYVISLE